jgi:hypothetical protein
VPTEGQTELLVFQRWVVKAPKNPRKFSAQFMKQDLKLTISILRGFMSTFKKIKKKKNSSEA